MEATVSTLASSEQRQSARRLVNFAAALREEGAKSTQARVTDLSEGGCRLRCDEPVEAGSEIWVKLPGLEAKRARLVWVEGENAGCEFETPLYQSEIDALATTKRRADPKSVFRRS
jgi:hypothetical protein